MEMELNLLVFNAGSSSLKCVLFRYDKQLRQIWKGKIHWHEDFRDAYLESAHQNQKITIASMGDAVEKVLEILKDHQIDQIAHRIVHGGSYIEEVIIDENVRSELEKVSILAPLHNGPQLEVIDHLTKHFPKTKQYAFFDTTFHTTIPLESSAYAIEKKWRDQGIKKYGFHGINYQYCTEIAQELLKEHQRLLIFHLGAGSSLCAVRDGRSIETTMGFTPLDGLVMNTRSGQIDPGVLLYMLKEKWISVEELDHMLNFQSGLLGLSGFSGDLKEILKQESEDCEFAYQVFLHRIQILSGAMIASLQGVDALVFTGGIGENSLEVRSKICEKLAFLGVKIDGEKNQQHSENPRIISSSDSKVSVCVIPAQEELSIAMQVLDKTNK